MAVKPWSFWLAELRPHVPGCPDVLAKAEIRRAAQALLESSRAWQVDLAPLPVAAGQSAVTVAVADAVEQKLVRVEAVWYDGKELRPATPKALDAQCSDDWKTHTGTPVRFLQLTPGTVTLYPKPVTAAITGLQARVSLMPGEESTGLPEDIASLYTDVIQAGARARLMIYPKKSWTDINLAGVYASAFSGGVDKARAEVARAFVNGRIASRPTWC